MNLKIEHCRGQCYDGASSMSGAKKGVTKIIRDEEPRASLPTLTAMQLTLL